MKKFSGAIFVSLLIVLLAGYVLAEETKALRSEQPGKEKEQPPMAASCMQGKMPVMEQAKDPGQKPMMCPMCGKMMGGMKGQMPMMENVMIGGSMTCPMCGKMMGDMKNMGQKPVMGSGMICPMCGKKMDGPGMIGMMPGTPDMIFKLDLSKEQVDKIKGILTTHEKDMIKMKADRDIAEVELREAMQKDELDLIAIKDLIRNIASLEADMKYSQIKVWVDAKSVLTDEQRTNLKKMMESKQPLPKEAIPDKPGPMSEHEGHIEQ